METPIRQPNNPRSSKGLYLNNQFNYNRALAQIEATDTIPPNSALAQALQQAEARLLSWANQSTTYKTVLLELFPGASEAKSNSLQALISGQGLGIPVKIVDGNSLVGLAGAYASASPEGSACIYLNGTWLETASAEKIEAVLLEELGHAIDRHLLGSSDSPGDEGELFSARLRGLALPTPAITEQDQREVNINGILTEIEASTLSTSLQFDGVDDCIEIADHADLDLGKNFTLEAWINPYGPGQTNGGGIIFNKENDYELARFEDGTIRFAITASASGDWWGWHDTGYNAQLNTWTHVALTFSSGIATVFINGGALKGGSEYQFSDPSVTRASVNDNTNPLRIGGRKDPSNTSPSYQHFDGLIANARVWKKAKYPSDIGDNYNRATPLSSAGLVGSWDLHEGSGSTALDSSPTPKNGTLVGFSQSPWVTDSPSVNVPGINAVIYVTSNSDAGFGSLRQAIIDANASAGDDVIDFALTGSTPYTITLSSALPDIIDANSAVGLGTAGKLKITGPGATQLTINSSGNYSIFTINSGGDLTLSGATIYGAYNSGNGGAFYNAGSLHLDSAVLTNNTAARGAGIYNDSSANLDVSNTTFYANHATQFGGGIYNASANLANVTSSTFNANWSDGKGGGIYVGSQSSLNLTNSTLYANYAPEGGGVQNDGTLNSINNTLYYNNGYGTAGGGGIKNNGTVNIINTIITNSPGGSDYRGTNPLTSRNNIVADGTITSGATTVDPALSALEDNGGPTLTMALREGSPALRAGDAASSNGAPVSGLDQRGFARSATAPNIGAFEDSALPSFLSAAANSDGTKIILAFSEKLANTTAATTDFQVTVAGSAATINRVAVNGSTIELVLNRAIKAGQSATVAYTDPSASNDANAIQDIAGNDAASIATTSIINNWTTAQAIDPNFGNQTINPFGINQISTSIDQPSLADIDGDGDLDLIVGVQNGNTLFYINSAPNGATNPAYKQAVVNPYWIASAGSFAAPTFADIDKDGDLDLFIGNRAGNILFFRNSAQGGSSSPGYEAAVVNPFGISNAGGAGYATPVFVDIDNDQDLDLFTGNRQGDIIFFRNTAQSNSTAPAYAAASANPFGIQNNGWHSSPEFVDIDGDGDLDFFTGHRYGMTFFQRNRAANASVTPDFAPPAESPFNIANYGHFSTLSFADFNHDGQVDLLRGNANGNLMVQIDTNDFITPSFVSAATSYNGSKIILTYSEALATTNLASTSNFAVTVGGSPATISSLAINGSAIELTLATPISNGQTVTVAYTDPTSADDTNAIQDSAGNDAATLATTGVTNNVLMTPIATAALSADTGSSSTDFITNTAAQTISGTTSANLVSGEFVEVSLDNGNSWSTAQVSSGTNTWSLAGQTLASSNTLKVRFSDSAGNTSTEYSQAYTLDTTPPSGDSNLNYPIFATGSQSPFGLNKPSAGHGSVALIDIDGDGDLDVFSGSTDGEILYYRNTSVTSTPEFAAETKNPFGIVSINGGFGDSKTTLADIDGDLDFDLITGGSSGSITIQLNTGTPSNPIFGSASINPYGITSTSGYAIPTLVDSDGDGDLDLFVGNNLGNVLFFRNSGSSGAPSYEAAITNPFGISDVGDRSAPTLADIDLDGDLDLLVGRSDGNILYFENTKNASGDPAYRSPTFLRSANNTGDASPALADLNGDGILDLLVSNGTKFYLNTGSGSASLIPVTSSTANGSYSPGAIITITLQFSEVVFVTGFPQLQLETGLNDQYATYSSGSGSTNLSFQYTVVAGDSSTDLDQLSSSALTLNGGTIKDAAGNNAHLELSEPGSPGSLASNAQIIVDTIAPVGTLALPGGSPATFAAPSSSPFGIPDIGSNANPELSDVDGDNDLDLFIGNRDGNTIYFKNNAALGSTAPAYEYVTTNPFGITDIGNYASPVLSDVDRDGDLDLFIGNQSGNTVYFQNTAALGSTAPAYAAGTTNPFGITDIGDSARPVFSDVDRDGDLDLFIGTYVGNTIYFKNTATLGSTAPAYAAGTTNPFGITNIGFYATPELSDVDGDGDLDLFIGNISGNTVYFKNTAALGSTAPAYEAGTTNPFGITDIGTYAIPVFTDIDRDGDLDLFIGNRDGNTLFILNTAVTYVAPVTSTKANGTYGVGTIITLNVAFSENVTVDITGGVPRLQLETGTTDQYATYSGGTGSNILTFTYTVQAGHSSADLDYTSFSALELNGATIQDAAGNDAVLTLAAPGSAGSLSANAQLVIDGVPPTGSLGSYATTPAYSAPSTNPFGITNVGGYANPTLTDIDADGDLDLFIGYLDGNTLLFTNTASSGATAPAYSAATTNPFGITNVGQFPSPTFGDIDADGDLDLFIGIHDRDTLLFRNIASLGDTAPAYSEPSTNPFGITFFDYRINPSLVDIDDDGDLDLIIGYLDGNTLLFTNTASSGATAPAYSAATTNPFGTTDVGGLASPTFADIDSDGDLDLFIGNGDGNTLLFTNIASPGATVPAYSAATTNPFGISNVGFYANPTVADIDGDGDLDLFIGNHYGDTLLFTNTAATPVAPVAANTPNGSYGIGSVITITIGFSEAVLVDITGGTPRLQLETGSTDRYATYSSGTGSNTLFFEYTVQAGDTSADLDQLSSSALTLNGGTIKDAAGNNALLELAEPGSTGSLASNAQIIIDTRGPAGTLALPGGYPAAFAAPSGSPFGITDIGDNASPVFTDIDGDGDLDLFIGNSYGRTFYFKNTATPGSTAPAYEYVTTNPFGITNVGSYASPVFTDIDGDGDLDLFIGLYYGDTVYFKNTAAPGSTAPAYEYVTTNPFGITNVDYNASPVFTDIDGDGDLDLFIGNSYGRTFYFKNTATPGSTAPAYEYVTTNPFGITDIGDYARPVFTDIDGDGDLDLFIGNRDGNTLFFKNTAALGSTAPTYEACSTNPFGITDIGRYASPVLTDIDGDGDLDLFIGNRDGNTLFFQNTAVTYVAPVTSTKPNGTYGVGDTISLEVQFTKGLVLTGSPRLRLETGSIDRFATFTGLSTTSITNDTLTFTYTVQIGDSSADLDQSSPNALDLNGGTLKDAAGTDAILTLALPGSSGSLAANGTLTINTSTNNTSLGQNGADPDYERGKDINGDNIKDDLQSAVTTFDSPHGPSSLALKTVVLNQDISDYGGSVVANTLLFFDALTGDSNAINGLQLSVSTTNPGTTNSVASASDLINFTVTPTVTTTGDVRGLDVAQIRNNAIAVFQSTIQEIDIYFPENASASGGSWNALYKTRKAQNNSIEYYLFDYDPLTGLGGMLLDRDGNRSIDGARLYLKDGELGDFDEDVNGRIDDPIGFTTLFKPPTLEISGDGKGLTVDGVEGTGLWISLTVSSFSSSSQSNLEMYNNGQPIGAIGATLGSGPTGSQVIYLAAGSTLSFRSSDGAGNSSNKPALSIASTPTGYSLGLDADRNGSYTDLMLDISSSIAASSPASLAIARKQLSSSDAILDLTSIAATGITLTLDISTDCSLRNRFGFVKLDPLTGTTYQVNGVSQNDGAAFRNAILSQFVDPYQGSSTSHRHGQSRQSISWALDSSAAGFYAPVMITQGGEVLTFGASTASDGRQHVKLLGNNTFGFEDLLASQGSDWDFNDTKIRVSVA